MAVNPITSESLTVDFKSLMKIPVGDRMKAVNINPDFLQSILSALTPIQIANAFPNYYKRQLPDVSNFITSYITSRNGGNFNQTGGGAGGYMPDYYDSGNNVSGSARPRGAPEPTIEEMKKKLLERGIDVDGAYTALSQGAILEGDEKFDYLKKMSDEQLASAGMQRTQDENGKTVIKLSELPSAKLTDEQIIVEMKKEASSQEGTYRPVYPLSDIDLSPEVINTIAGEALNNKESIDGVINNMLNRVGAQSNWTNLKDVARDPGQYAGYKNATEEQAEVIRARIKEIASGKVQSNIGAATEFRAEYYVRGEGYGKTFEREARQQGYLQPGPGDNIYAETFAAGPYAPRKKEDVEKIKLENAAKINKSYTPEEVKKFREDRLAREVEQSKEKAIRNLYNQASPTSSEAIPDPEGRTVVEQQQEVAGVRKGPITTELKQSLLYAASQSGDDNYEVRLKVTSGGQRMEGAEGATGSHRHDEGGAADFNGYLIDRVTKKEILLDPRNPEHIPYISKLTTNFSRVHPDAGVGALYMDDPTKIHFGGDDVSEHGGRARGPLAYAGPQWFKDAHAAGIQQRTEDKKNKVDPLQAWLKEQEKLKEEAAAKAPTVPEQKAAEVPAPETVASATPATTPVPQFALGGNMYGINEDMTLVETATGNPIAQIGQNEKIEKQGNAIQVTSETKLKADELTNKYDSSSEMEDRIANVEDSIQNQAATNQVAQKARAPEKVQTETPHRWRESIAAGERPVSPSFNRAMARTKFFNEGHHFARSAPGSQS